MNKIQSLNKSFNKIYKVNKKLKDKDIFNLICLLTNFGNNPVQFNQINPELGSGPYSPCNQDFNIEYVKQKVLELCVDMDIYTDIDFQKDVIKYIGTPLDKFKQWLRRR